VSLKATVSSTVGTPTGTVYFMDGFTTLGSAALSGGTATYSVTSLTVGAHAITARYSGDSNFMTLTSTSQTVTINLLTPTVALTATPATATVRTSIAFGATVTGTGPHHRHRCLPRRHHTPRDRQPNQRSSQLLGHGPHRWHPHDHCKI
jgi:hypothetical protein